DCDRHSWPYGMEYSASTAIHTFSGPGRIRGASGTVSSAIHDMPISFDESMPERLQNYIEGSWTNAGSGETFSKVNPARTSDVIGRFPASGPEDIDAAVASAREAFISWSR